MNARPNGSATRSTLSWRSRRPNVASVDQILGSSSLVGFCPRCSPLISSYPLPNFLFHTYECPLPSSSLIFKFCSFAGQAESGKSTVLRNFQLKYAPSTFHAEAEAWRAIIDLNLVRSVTFLLRLLDEDSAGPVAGSSSSSSGATSPAVDAGAPVVRSSNSSVSSRAKSSNNGIGVGFAGPGGEDDDARPLSPSSAFKLVPLHRLTDDLRRLHMSLSPLRSIEESLVRVISPDSPRNLAGGPSSSSSPSSAALPTERAFEVSVRSGSRWKSLFNRNGGSASVSRATGKGHQELTNARRVIEACREDIIALWNHPAVRKGLDEQNVALEFQSGLYVSDHIGLFSPRRPTNQLSPHPFSPRPTLPFSPFRPFFNTGSFFSSSISLLFVLKFYVSCAPFLFF